MDSLNCFCFCLCAPIGLWAWCRIIGRALRARSITFNRGPTTLE